MTSHAVNGGAKLPGEASLVECSFTLEDVADTWCEVVEDDDAEIPGEVLQRFLRHTKFIDEALCERGFEAIRLVLEEIRAGLQGDS